MNTMTIHSGNCFCGTVEIEVNGAPEAMGYCHCSSCRSWSAAPVNAFTLWKPENVKVTKGAEFVGHFMKTKNSDRQYCTKCGGHLMNYHPADEGWTSQAEGLPGRTGRVWRSRAGVA